MSPKKHLNKMYSVLNKNKKDIEESWVDETKIQGVDSIYIIVNKSAIILSKKKKECHY
jgi:hypothetical protein